MNPQYDIETEYASRVPLEHRKRYAQFFTPHAIAEVLARWILGNENLETVLDPAFGLGILSRTLLSKKRTVSIKGFDIDERIFSEAKQQYANLPIEIHLQDYMYNDWENKYDGIICNPPYFKFHDYDNKTVINEIEKRLSCKLNGFTNLYTLFLLKSIHQLKEGGRCAYIVPSEFMNSDYGKLVKKHLIKTKSIRYIVVFDFDENVFDDALTTSCIILCANDNQTDKIQFINISDIHQLSVIQDITDNYPKITTTNTTYRLDELDPNIKWKNYYQRLNGHKYKRLVPFSKYAKVMRGIATGSNDYFTFSKTKAEKYGIDEKFLLPCICHCTDVCGQVFSKHDFDTLKDRDKKVYLLNVKDERNERVKLYLEEGVANGIDKKYLTASRNPWYSLERRPPAPIWVSVFNRKGLRFVRNKADVANLTTFHCIYPSQDIFSNISADLLFAYLQTPTAQEIFNDNAREYGNGLQKFEQNDLNKGMMLDLKSLSETKLQEIDDMSKKYSQTNDIQIIKDLDKILATEFSN